ncbi:MAG: hypothetical protein VYD77_00395 [Actinomycetota bacterium]|nr:hypothetical protein [Actinomycetota bacterium]|tara:strand:- start:734 stop:919 length:186 start_codon:yes stop_codon:yes gene_type:complete
MKKGRHRRYEEARALKQQNDQLDDLFTENEMPCAECEALPGQDHKDWCLAQTEIETDTFPS